jgi:chromate transporter
MHRVRLGDLVRVFAWTGLTSIGGGRAGYFHESLVVRHRWADDDEFLQDLTISQLLPGPNVSNLAVAIGYRLAGLAGSIGAWLSLILPGALILLALTLLYFKRGLGAHAGAALSGMGAAVVGLMLVTNARLMRGASRGRAGAWIAAATFLAVGVFRVNMGIVVVAMTVLGLWLNRPGAVAVPAASADGTAP